VFITAVGYLHRKETGPEVLKQIKMSWREKCSLSIHTPDARYTELGKLRLLKHTFTLLGIFHDQRQNITQLR